MAKGRGRWVGVLMLHGMEVQCVNSPSLAAVRRWGRRMTAGRAGYSFAVRHMNRKKWRRVGAWEAVVRRLAGAWLPSETMVRFWRTTTRAALNGGGG